MLFWGNFGDFRISLFFVLRRRIQLCSSIDFILNPFLKVGILSEAFFGLNPFFLRLIPRKGFTPSFLFSVAEHGFNRKRQSRLEDAAHTQHLDRIAGPCCSLREVPQGKADPILIKLLIAFLSVRVRLFLFQIYHR